MREDSRCRCIVVRAVQSITKERTKAGTKAGTRSDSKGTGTFDQYRDSVPHVRKGWKTEAICTLGINGNYHIPNRRNEYPSMMNEANFGPRLRKLRKARGWTLWELAIRSKLSESAISRWERENRIPTMRSLVKLAAALEIEVESLFRDEAA